MDCLTAQELLEAAHPGSASQTSPADELSLPELELALAHAEACPTCAAVWEMMQTRDRAIARAMHAVPVPEGLEGRLLERLGLTGSAWAEPFAGAEHADADDAGEVHWTKVDQPVAGVPVADLPVTQQPAGVESVVRRSRRGTRRQLVAALCVVSASLLVGAGIWSWLSVPSEITLAELQRAVPDRLTALPAFDGNFAIRLPREFQHQPAVREVSPARGLLLPGGSRHVAALYELSVVEPHRRTVRTVLLIMPIERVDVAPQTLSPSLLTAAEESVGRRAVAAWSDGGYLYACFVDRRDGALQDVKQAVTPGLT